MLCDISESAVAVADTPITTGTSGHLFCR